MRSIFKIIILITVVSTSGYAQTSFHRDTILFEDVVSSYSYNTDSVACGELVEVSFASEGVLIGHEVVYIDLYVKGRALGDVRPDDIRINLVGSVAGLDYTERNSGDIPVRPDAGAPTGSFSVSRRLNFMNDLYDPDVELEIVIYPHRGYHDHPSNPVCGTEEAYIDTWQMIITYYTDDVDLDGYTIIEDCDDDDPYVNPGEREYCGNGKDDNCDGSIDEIVDNYVTPLPYGGYQYSQGSLDTCDNVIVPTRVTWDITQGAKQRQTKFQGASYKVFAGGKLILGGDGCRRTIDDDVICTGEHIATPDFEVRLGGELEMGPFSMIGEGGCLFCIIEE